MFKYIRSLFIALAVFVAFGCSKSDKPVVITSCNWAGMKIDQAYLVEGLKRYHPEVKVKVNELGSVAMIYATATDKSSDVIISSDGSFGVTFTNTPWNHNLKEFREETNKRLNKIGYEQVIFNVDNNYAFLTSKATYDKLGCTKMSEVAKIPGIKYACEFTLYERESDINFKKALEFYNTVSRDVTPADNNVLYEAVSKGTIDVFLGESGSGYEKKYGLIELKDDKEFFPQYKHAVAIKTDICPEVKDVVFKMQKFMNTSDTEDYILSVLNEKESWESVAKKFWDSVENK